MKHNRASVRRHLETNDLRLSRSPRQPTHRTPRPADTGAASSHSPSLWWTLRHIHILPLSPLYICLCVCIYIYTYMFHFIYIYTSFCLLYFTCIHLYLSSLFFIFYYIYSRVFIGAATLTTNFPLGINKVYIYLSIYLYCTYMLVFSFLYLFFYFYIYIFHVRTTRGSVKPSQMPRMCTHTWPIKLILILYANPYSAIKVFKKTGSNDKITVLKHLLY